MSGDYPGDGDYPGIARALDDYDEREARQRAHDILRALDAYDEREVSRVKLKLAVAAARLVEMPCGHTVPSNPLRPDWCSACERLTGGVE